MDVSGEGTLAFGVEPSRTRYRLRLARYKALAEAVCERLAAAPPAPGAPLRLLDLGVGHGRTRRYLEAEGVVAGIDFHGLDRSPARLARAAAHGGWRLCRATLEAELPYASDAFDVVVCEQVLEHLHDPRPALREMRRVLRPGGLLVLGVPSFPPGIASLRRAALRLRKRWRVDDHFHLQTFTARSLRRIARAEGYRVDAVRGFRVIDGGVLLGLSDHAWWYRLNRALGRHAPGLCIEVQLLATRPGAAAERGGGPRPRAATGPPRLAFRGRLG